jgi:threonine dehydrogenase-like Zn-dependent dehydrogenase
MKQSILVKPQQSRLEDRPIPEPGQEDVVVRVKACGVCASELNGWKGDGGTYPKEYGHEVAGDVVAVGSGVKGITLGMRVTGLFSKGFAEYTRAPQQFVTPIPDGMAYEHALGEPLGCILSGARRTNVELGDTVALVGLGFMGLLMLQAVRLRGPARIIAIDTRSDALESARQFGADETYTPDSIPDRLMMTEWGRVGKGFGADVVFENSGTSSGLTLASRIVREHGILSIVGWHQGGTRQVDMEMWNWKGFNVINAHERRPDYLMDCMRRGLSLVASGRMDTGSLISHRFSLDNVDGAFRVLVEKPAGFHKAIVLTG